MAILDFFKRKKKVAGQRGFAAAQYNRLVNDWVTSSASIDAELRGSLKTLRNRTRDLCRNNDYAKNALRAIENNVIGQGVRLQSQVTQTTGRNANKLNDRVNTAIEAAWAEWCKKDACHTAGTLSFADIERLLISSVAESGEVFVRVVRKKFGRSEVAFALEILEADLLDEDHNEILRNGNEVRFGIERDEWLRPVAYYFKTKHPGDYTFTGTADRGKIRVPAADVIHLFRQTRPGQTRGFPWFAPAIVRMHHLHGFEEAEVIKARAQASIMGFIKSEGDGLTDGTQDNQRVTNFEPGTIEHLLPGEDFTSFSPTSPGGQFEPFLRAMLRAVAAGIGVSYETLSRDYSQSNYSSSRLALLDDRDNWRTLQQWMIENFHHAVFEQWLEMAWLSGAVDLPNYAGNEKTYKAVRFVPRGWSWVDPVKEVNAYKDAVRSGFMTVSDVVAASGQDFDELVTQRKREIDTTESLDLVFDTDAGKVAGNGQATGQAPAAPAADNTDVQQ
jgi:lambda family phage portal protein